MLNFQLFSNNMLRNHGDALNFLAFAFTSALSLLWSFSVVRALELMTCFHYRLIGSLSLSASIFIPSQLQL